jgi:choline dehydrogenase-like flavoprotein
MTARFDLDDEDVIVVIGSGAGGGTLSSELAAKGLRVVVLEAGKRQEVESFVNDEWTMFKRLSWLDKRTTSGNWRVARDFPNLPAWTVKAVGGTTIHWAGASLRIREHEFRARTHYGAVPGTTLIDWPIGLADLTPYYERAENRLGVTRTHGIPGLPGNNNFQVFAAGASKLGYRTVHTGRMAINPEPRDGRSGCQQLGFCFQGCKFAAKWSTLYSDIPHGEATGRLEVRAQSQALHILHNRAGKASGVVYAKADGTTERQRARIVCVAGNAIETARLLLNSHSARFAQGLANGSGEVGRNYMRHTTGSVYAIFDKAVNMYRGTTMAGIITDESRHDPKRGFVGGYELETISLGLPFLAVFLNPGAWGRDYAADLEQYENMAGLWIVGEDMPQSSNRVTLHETGKDEFGAPIPHVHYDDHKNDLAMRTHAYEQASALYQSVGAVRTIRTPPYPSTHNLGTARMSTDPERGVVNQWGEAHEMANLYVSDGSVFPTGAAENPTLTIVALALRQADRIEQRMKAGEL